MNRKNTKEDRINESFSIELVFSPFVIIETLLLPEIIESIRDSSNGRDKEDAFQGYRLALICSVVIYMDHILRSPEILGFKIDSAFYDFYFFSKSLGKDTLKSVTRRNHSPSGLLARVQSIYDDLLAAKNWEDLNQHLANLREFSLSLRRIFTKSFKSYEKVNSRWHRVNPEESLLRRTFEIVWGELLNTNFVNRAYSEVYREQRNLNVFLDGGRHHYHDSESSRLSPHDDDPWDNHFSPPKWASGYVQTILLTLAKLSPEGVHEELWNLYPQAKTFQSWRQVHSISQKTKNILGDIPEFIRPRGKWLFEQRAPVAAIDRRALMVPVRTLHNTEQIKGLLGNSLRIVESESPASAFNFACLIDGVVTRAKSIKEKALIAEIQHPMGRNENDYSFAVFMPARGGFFNAFNASCWWVFYDICNDFTGGARSVLEQIKQCLSSHSESIEIIRFPLRQTDLLDLCEDPGYRYLRQEIDYCQRLDSEIRADFPELLLAAYLGFFQCHPIRCRIRPKFLAKEIDVVGVKWIDNEPDEVIVFESKGKATTYKDLQDEIDIFAEKLQRIQENLKSVAGLLSVPYSEKLKLQGYFVSMARLEATDIKVPFGVTLWDFNQFQKELTRARIPREYKSLLKEKILARIFGLDSTFKELFFGDPE